MSIIPGIPDIVTLGAPIFSSSAVPGGVSVPVSPGTTYRIKNNGNDNVRLCETLLAPRGGEAFRIGGNGSVDYACPQGVTTIVLASGASTPVVVTPVVVSPGIAGVRRTGVVPVASRVNAYHNATATGQTVATYRIRHVVQCDCSNLELTYGNFSRRSVDQGVGTATYAEVPGPNPISVRVGIEVTNFGTGSASVKRLDFGGQNSVVIMPDGEATGRLYGSFRKGDVIWERCEVTPLDGTTLQPSAAASWSVGLTLFGTTTQLNLGGGEGQVLGSAYAYGGAIPVVNSTSAFAYSAYKIRGVPVPGQTFGIVGVMGDSTSSPSMNDDLPDYGDVMRVTNAAGDLLLVGLGCSSDATVTAAAQDGHRIRALHDCLDVVVIYGLNDLLASATLSVWQTAALQIWRDLWMGGCRVHATTITPRPSDAGTSYANLAGQTVNADEAMRVGANDWMRAGAPLDPTTLLPVAVGTVGAIPCPYLVDVVERADVCESSRNSGKWANGGILYSGTVTTGDTGASGQTFYDTASTGGGGGAYNGMVALFKSGANAGKGVRLGGSNVGSFYHFGVPGGTISVGDAFDVVKTYSADGTHMYGFVYALMAAAYSGGGRFQRRTY